MLHLHCARPSDGASKLAQMLRDAGVPTTRGRSAARATKRVCWGSPTPVDSIPTLNPATPENKLTELIILGDNDVPHVPFQLPPLGFTPVGDDWHPRRRNHQGGTDLRNPPTVPDYWVRRLPIVNEFRLHVWAPQGAEPVVCRAGLKVGGEGWIRNHDAGWRFDYGAACQAVLRQSHRDLAKSAVRALGLDFGAVDLGVVDPAAVARGDYPHAAVVLEVNTAPGLDNDNTAAAYVTKIKAWYEATA